MKKELLAVLVSSMLLGSMVTGCSASSSNSGSNTNTTTSNNTSSVNTSSESTTEEPYHLTLAYVGSEQRDAEMVYEAINELTLKELNMTMDIVQLGFGDYEIGRASCRERVYVMV